MIPRAAAQLALLVSDAMTMAVSAGLADLAPAPTAHLAANWSVRGYLIADDHVGLIGERVCYGYLAQRNMDPDQFVAVLRGTHGPLEWLIDSEFVPVPYAHPIAGTVEAGFYDLYRSMQYVPKGGAPCAAPAGLATAVGAVGTLTVIGHSLGAAMATYLAFDVAWLLRERMSACLFASPQPGDAAFCKAFDARVADYALYDAAADVVPEVPLGPDYTHLPRRTLLPKSPLIRDDLECHHNILSYATLLDPTLAPTLAGQARGCIL